MRPRTRSPPARYQIDEQIGRGQDDSIRSGARSPEARQDDERSPAQLIAVLNEQIRCAEAMSARSGARTKRSRRRHGAAERRRRRQGAARRDSSSARDRAARPRRRHRGGGVGTARSTGRGTPRPPGRALLELIAECKQQNQRNGALLKARSEQVRTALKLLRGGASPGLYERERHEARSARSGAAARQRLSKRGDKRMLVVSRRADESILIKLADGADGDVDAERPVLEGPDRDHVARRQRQARENGHRGAAGAVYPPERQGIRRGAARGRAALPSLRSPASVACAAPSASAR